MYQSETLTAVFLDRVASDGDRVALHVPSGDGAYRPLTWNDVIGDVRRMAAVLGEAGVSAGDRVAQVSENRYEWIVADLAILLLRAIHVPLHSVLAGPQIAWQIADAEARAVVLSSPEQAAKFEARGISLPATVEIFSHDCVDAPIEGRRVRNLAALTGAVGDAAAAVAPLEASAIAHAQPDDLATILYTSGTTGEAKGVMLSHGNLLSNAQAACEAFDVQHEDVRLAWLPLSHIFARTCDLYTWIVRGAQLALGEGRERIIANCQAVRPTLLNGVPYFFDKVRQHLLAQPDGQSPGRLQQLLGGRIRICCSGGAALSDQTAEFFWQHGVPLVQGYGLTETSPVISVSTREANKIGSVGRAVPGVEVRIAADGEILTRGPHVMLGYWNRPQATAETTRDGWLATGDIGQLDADGYLWITGRKKELIVTAAGKNIAPTYLEGLLAADPLVAQVMIVGDDRKCLTALIVPNPDALRAEIVERKIAVASREQALVHPEVLALYRQRIDERLADVSRDEQVRGFKLIGRAFAIEEGELTPTLKLRRKVIEQHFAREIDEMYAAASAVSGV